MPFDGSVGYSRHTPEKQQHFREICKTYARVCKGVFKKNWAHPIMQYFDLNAGSGYVNNRPGSPIIFGEEACKANVEFNASLFEENHDAFVRLSNSVLTFNEWNGVFNKFNMQAYFGDHYSRLPEVVLKHYCKQSKPAFGFMYSDENGDIPPFNLISSMMDVPCFKTLDVVLYLSATTIKRVRRAFPQHEENNLECYLRSIGKKHIIVREPAGRHQWTFAICTNWGEFPEFKTQHFHHIETSEGREIFRRLNLTAKELDDDPSEEDA